MNDKTLLEKVEEAGRRPLPDEPLPSPDIRQAAITKWTVPSDDNPRHKEDFTRLLGVAARKRERED